MDVSSISKSKGNEDLKSRFLVRILHDLGDGLGEFFHWKVIDLFEKKTAPGSPNSDSSESDEVKNILYHLHHTMPSIDQVGRGSTAVKFGSKIYLVGGFTRQGKYMCYESSSCVFYFDMSKPEDGWMSAKSMIVGLKSTSAICAKEKLYVFGGGAQEACSGGFVIGEVYDPKDDEWEKIIHPSNYVDNKWFWDCIDPENTLLLVRKRVGSLSSFDIDSKSWTTIEPVGFSHCGQHFAVLDKLLYVYSTRPSSSIYCYDLNARRWLPEGVKLVPKRGFSDLPFSIYPPPSLFPLMNSECYASLFHLGNNSLCMVWTKYHSEKANMTVITTVFHINPETPLVAEVESCSRHTFDGYKCADLLLF